MNTTPISSMIKDTYIPALKSVDIAINQAIQGQRELKSNLERLGAEMAVLMDVCGVGSAESQDAESLKKIDQGLAKCAAIRKRLIQLIKHLNTVIARYKRIRG